MTLPSTLTPARRAIVHALTQATGKVGALTRLFHIMPPARGAERAVHLKGAPGVWVVVRVNGSGPLLDQSDRQQFACTAEITCSYWSGNPLSESESDATQRLFEEDGPAIVAALTSQGALDLDPDGNESGITGGQMLRDGYASRGPDPWPVEPGKPRVVRVVHSFPFLVELSRSTT